MKISFVVPVYCVENYIGQCVKSLQEQFWTDLEIILVDDGSTDRSGELCEEYAEKDNRIKVIRQKNHGVSAARNVGIEIASGEWVCFIDGDDAVVPSLCCDFLPYLQNDCEVCFFGHREILDEEFPKKIGVIEKGKKIGFSASDFLEFQLAAFNRDYPGRYDYHEVKLSTPCKFYRRDFLEKYHIRFPIGVPIGEDCLFNLQVYRYASKGVYLDYQPYLHRIWSKSVSKKYNSKVFDDFGLLHAKLKEFITTDPESEKYNGVYAQRCIWSLGFCCILNYCHPDYPGKYSDRRNDFLSACDSEMGYSASDADLHSFRISKRILFFLIKKRWFSLIYLLCISKRKIGKG